MDFAIHGLRLKPAHPRLYCGSYPLISLGVWGHCGQCYTFLLNVCITVSQKQTHSCLVMLFSNTFSNVFNWNILYHNICWHCDIVTFIVHTLPNSEAFFMWFYQPSTPTQSLTFSWPFKSPSRPVRPTDLPFPFLSHHRSKTFTLCMCVCFCVLVAYLSIYLCVQPNWTNT